MPSTYTNSLRIEKIADGEQNQAWGQTVNRQLDLIDTAVAGVTVINVTGQTQIIMTAATGTVDQARAAVLVMIGTLNVDCRVVYPSTPKTLMVFNAIGGSGRVILASGSGGSPFPLSAGEGGLFYLDGVNVNPLGGARLVVNEIKSYGSAEFGSSKFDTVGNAGFLASTGAGTGSSGPTPYSIRATSAVVAERYFATSDRRVKADIVPLTQSQGTAWVMSAKPVHYRMANDDRQSTGFIAQDQRAVGYEHIVGGFDDADMPQEGEDAGIRLTFDYVQTIAYLTAHAQQLEARLTALETKHGA